MVGVKLVHTVHLAEGLGMEAFLQCLLPIVLPLLPIVFTTTVSFLGYCDEIP